MIEADEAVTTLPPESSTLTTGWVAEGRAVGRVARRVVKTSWVAAPVASEKVGSRWRR